MIFALDIGTRKVAGILGYLKNGKIYIHDSVIYEHKDRAMIDGQIHDIEAVSSVIRKIKNELEEKNNVKITKVVTALAGRSLYTENVEIVLDKKGEITKEDIQKLELESVKKANFITKHNEDYYCVGYSPILYTVDGEVIKNISGQIAKKTIGVKSIVTFLPKRVFENLISVLKRVDITLDVLTLEPIAAINVTIPPDMRLLNLALVDVGAGTSDIAITEKGKIIQYGMLPKAGDEITEEICNTYIVDFNTGEYIKRNIGEKNEIIVKDILNNEIKITYEDFKNKLKDKINEIAKEIADSILTLNGKQPAAVVMVGGGGSLILLKEKVAENLQLPINRVGSRLPQDIKNIESIPDLLKGTDGITPIGILNIGIERKGIGFNEIVLNNEKEYVINLDEKVTVLDVLKSKRISLKTLYAKPGESITYTLNGEFKILRGEKGIHAKILVNDKETDLEHIVKNGDNIKIIPAKDGKNAFAKIKDVISKDYFLTVEINGEVKTIEPVILVNGKEVSMEETLLDRSDIQIKKVDKLEDVLKKCGYSFSNVEERDIIITVNNEPVILKQRNYKLCVNGIDVSKDFKVKNMDKIEYKDTQNYYRIKDILKKSPKIKMKVIINKKEYEIEKETFDIYMNGKKVSEEEFIINGARIEIKLKDDEIILSNIFKFFKIDIEKTRGKLVDIKVNGEKAGFTTPIKDGDNIEIMLKSI